MEFNFVVRYANPFKNQRTMKVSIRRKDDFENGFYKELKKYSRNLTTKHFFNYTRVLSTVCIDDLINEAIVNGCRDISNAKKIIRNHFINEARTLSGKRQYSDIPASYEKKCKGCGEIKLACEFTERFDKRYNLKYLNYLCRVCDNERTRIYKKNKPYTEEEKVKAKIRYQRYKLKQNMKKKKCDQCGKVCKTPHISDKGIHCAKCSKKIEE